jgi:hypothetical protein
MSITTTGTLVMYYAAPVWIPDAMHPDGGREDQQLSITLKAAADEKEYQFNLPITDKTPATKQLDEWQAEAKLVTVYSSSVRALSFLHDNTKDEHGNPLKKYQRAGRKVQVGDVTVETDAFVVFAAYDIRLAGTAELEAEAQKAHGDYLRKQAEYRKRSVQARIEKAKQLVEERRSQAKAAVATATAAAGAGATGGARKTA